MLICNVFWYKQQGMKDLIQDMYIYELGHLLCFHNDNPLQVCHQNDDKTMNM